MARPFIDSDLAFIVANEAARVPLSHTTLNAFRQTSISADTHAHFPHAAPPICHMIDGPAGPLEVYEYQPSYLPQARAALLWLHGGGYVKGHGDDAWFGALFAQRVGIRVFSVDYRLAPEHPFPAARDDGWSALHWLAANSERLGINQARLAIGGASAGAGLAAGLAIHNRDQAGPNIAFQLLLYPMLDHLHDNPAGYMDVPTWPRANSLQAWGMYLGSSAPCPSSVPSTATDLQGLPPAFLSVGEADLFLDDVRAYSAGLAAAGVPQDMRSYRGVFHGAEKLGYGTAIGQQMADDYVEALASALGTTPQGRT